MDILTIKNLKELPIVDKQDVGEVLAFDDGGNLVKVESVEYTIAPLFETFNDLTGDGRWWANASEYGFDGFSSVEINASEYGNNKYTEGYNIGTTDGYNVGREEGYTDGYNIGRQETVDNASELYVTNNGVYEGDLYKRVEVSVIPKISIKDSGMKLGNSSFTQIPDNIDFTDCTDFNNMFNTCNRLTNLNHPTLANVAPTNISNVFYFCGELVDLSPVSGWDTSNTKEMNYAFAGCSKLEDLTPIGNWDTSKMTRMNSFIYNCGKIHTIPALRADSLQSGDISVGYSSIPSVVNFGGLINLKSSQTSYFLEYFPNLNYESCINILNGLYDFSGHSETPNSSQGRLKVHQNFLDLVGDEINIGISKGWTITA